MTNVGRQIVANILAEKKTALCKFLEVGFDIAWMTSTKDLSRAAIFNDSDRDAYLFILRQHEANREVPSLGYFRHSFPEKTYRLPDEPGATTDELVEMAVKDRRRVQLECVGSEFIDLVEAGQHKLADELLRDYPARVKAAGAAASFDFLSFDELDDTPLHYRIAGLWPEGGHVLLSAYAKTGKTTLTMHLLKSLADGVDFLGRECNQVDGTAVYVNLELSQQMLRSYAVDAGLDLAHKKLRVLDWRGRAAHFRIGDAGWREALAAELREIHCDVFVIDPLSPVLAVSGIDSNDTDETRNVLENLGDLAALAGCDLFVVDHTGHADKSRARNSSAKLDWPDALWALQSVGGEDSPRRKIDVKGRGVHATLNYYMDDSGELVTGEFDDGPSLPLLLKPDIGQTVPELAAQMGERGKRPNPSTVSRQLNALERAGYARRERRSQKEHELWYSA